MSNTPTPFEEIEAVLCQEDSVLDPDDAPDLARIILEHCPGIVRACNTHEGLVNIAKRIVNFSEQLEGISFEYRLGLILSTLQKDAQAALAKARKETD